MTGITTTYRGVRFRSRVEATWAAFFDELRWPWRYEPLDLNGYIPDFVLPFPHAPVLIEVKHAFYLEELGHHVEKIDASGWQHEALIVGATYKIIEPYGPSFSCFPTLGFLRERIESEWSWGPAALIRCRECGQPSFIHAIQSYRCRASGCYDGDGHLCALPDAHLMWAAARNQTQWQPHSRRVTSLRRGRGLPRLHPLRRPEEDG